MAADDGPRVCASERRPLNRRHNRHGGSNSLTVTLSEGHTRVGNDQSPSVYRAEHGSIRPTGRRTWWAHLKFLPQDITLTILPKKLDVGT